ncbi:MAG: hypothetical protein JWN86_2493 [Planctomycetota bacterium]|nr:hypothetical protein [Planctomycetota bacterium]
MIAGELPFVRLVDRAIAVVVHAVVCAGASGSEPGESIPGRMWGELVTHHTDFGSEELAFQRFLLATGHGVELIGPVDPDLAPTGVAEPVAFAVIIEAVGRACVVGVTRHACWRLGGRASRRRLVPPVDADCAGEAAELLLEAVVIAVAVEELRDVAILTRGGRRGPSR